MSRNAFYFSFAFLAVLAIGIAVNDANVAIKQQHVGEKLLPGLYEALEEVDEVNFSAGEETTTLRRQADGWTVVQRFGFKADEKQLGIFLRALAAAEKREQKTAKPENYSRLGLGGEGLRVKVTGNESFELEIGDAARNREGRYVLFPESEPGQDNHVWLSNFQTTVTASALDWIDKHPIEVERKDIHEVILTQDEEQLVARRGDDGQFELVDKPEDSELRYVGIVGTLLDGLVNMHIEDVAPIQSIAFDRTHSAQFGLSDNQLVKIEVSTVDEDHWIRFVDQGLDEWAFKVSVVTFEDLTRSLADMLAIPEEEETS